MQAHPWKLLIAEPVSALKLWLRETERRLVGAHHQRQPDVGHLNLQSDKIRPGYAYYCVRLPIKRQSATDNIQVSGKTLSPEIMAQDYHRLSPFNAILFPCEEAAE